MRSKPIVPLFQVGLTPDRCRSGSLRRRHTTLATAATEIKIGSVRGTLLGVVEQEEQREAMFFRLRKTWHEELLQAPLPKIPLFLLSAIRPKRTKALTVWVSGDRVGLRV